MNKELIIEKILELVYELPFEEQLEILEKAKEDAQVNWEETESAAWGGVVP